jgi:hypothetical protein
MSTIAEIGPQTIHAVQDGIYVYIHPSLPVVLSNDWIFSSFPTTPGGAPIADYHVANKKYCDDLLAAVTPLSIQSKSATYTALVTDDVILCTGTWTLSLYTAVGNAGKLLFVKNNGTGIITVDPNAGETIDGESTVEIANQYSALYLMSDGTNWVIL